MRVSMIRAMHSDLGVTAIEYAMIAALISLAIFTGTQQVGGSVSGFFSTLATSF
jgi:Flp pilus assembly pilin Flp